MKSAPESQLHQVRHQVAGLGTKGAQGFEAMGRQVQACKGCMARFLEACSGCQQPPPPAIKFLCLCTFSFFGSILTGAGCAGSAGAAALCEGRASAAQGDAVPCLGSCRPGRWGPSRPVIHLHSQACLDICMLSCRACLMDFDIARLHTVQNPLFNVLCDTMM